MARRKGKMQEEILEVLRQHDQPKSAYELLATLRKSNPSLAPTAIYRALAALTERGAIHRLESLKAFIICQHGNQTHDCLMAICNECGAVEEHVSPTLINDVSAEAAKSGFAPVKPRNRSPWSLRQLWSDRSSGMSAWQGSLVRLLMLGAAPRLGIAAVIILLLWAGFFWATSSVET